MNDYIKIIDTEGFEHIVNKNLISEIIDGKDGCTIYACGHPIKTYMDWNAVISLLSETRPTAIDDFKRNR